MSVVEREKVGTSPVTVRDVLHRAADVLEEWGWRQKDYGSLLEGQFCLLGACSQAAEDLGLGIDLRMHEDLVMPYLRRVIPGAPHRWNDAQGRTKAEVVAALRAAADTIQHTP